MKSIRDRMSYAGPLWSAMATRLDAMVDAINELRGIVVVGQNPHKVNDTAHVIDIKGAALDLDEIIDLSQEEITDYEAHIGDTTYHAGADSANVVTELGVPEEIYALLNELKVDYEANRINPATHHGTGKPTLIYALLKEVKDDYNLNRANTSTHHGYADGTNVVAVVDADTKAKAFALANDIKAKLNAHMIWEGEDTTTLYALLIELKTDYTAHKALVDSVHAGADSGNGVTADDATSKATAFALANDLKTQFVANYANTSTHHTAADTINPPTFTALDGESTWIEITAAAAELRTGYIAHIAASTVWHGAADGTNQISESEADTTHGALDTTNTITVTNLDGDSTWIEIAEMTDACRTAYEAHRQIVGASEHDGADGSNVIAASLIGTIQALIDSVNVVTAVPDADTKAKAVTLANALKTKLNAHMAVTLNVHGAADTNIIVVADLVLATTTWTLIVALTDAIRTRYEAHIALVGSVHDGADATNTVTATAVGTIQTAVNAGLNELKGDFNTHILEEGTYHYVSDISMKVLVDNASSLATSRALVNAIKTAINDHISRADEFAAIPSLDLTE